jgi:hypothetical protein
MELAGRQIDVLVRWREHAREWARRHLPGMAESRRIDPDFNPSDDHVRELLKTVNQLLARPPHNYGVSNGNGSKRGMLVEIAIWASLALSAWTLKTVVDQGKEITRMQCQLSPSSCPQVVIRAP